MGIWASLEFSFKVRQDRTKEQVEDGFNGTDLASHETHVLQLIEDADKRLTVHVQAGGDMSYGSAESLSDDAKQFIEENADFDAEGQGLDTRRRGAVKVIENDSEMGESFWYVGPEKKAIQAMIDDANERLEATKAHLAMLNNWLQKASDRVGAWEG